MHSLNLSALGLLLLLLLSGCRGEELGTPSDAEPGQDFFPISGGRAWTWVVDSVIYDPVSLQGPVDTIRSWVREAVTDSLLSPAGTSYVLSRFTRRDTLAPWVWTKQFLVTPESNRLLWNEDNRIFIRALHPLYTGLTWSGTAFFDPLVTIPIFGESMQPYKSWSSRVVSKGGPWEEGGQYWPDVLVLRHADSENVIERRYCQEVWARGIGLVARQMEILDTQCKGVPADCIGVPWAQKAEKGYILRQILIDQH